MELLARLLFCIAFAWLPDVDALGQNPQQAQLVYIAGSDQSTPSGELFPSPLIVKAIDNTGVPFVGTPIAFETFDCISILGIGCYGAGPAAHFDSGSRLVTVYTDADGIASSPGLYAGDGVGWIQAGAYLLQYKPPYYIPPGFGQVVVFFLTETRRTVPVPALGPASLEIFLVLLLAVALANMKRDV